MLVFPPQNEIKITLIFFERLIFAPRQDNDLSDRLFYQDAAGVKKAASHWTTLTIEKASVKTQQQVYRVRPAPTSPPFYRPQRGLKVIRITADCLDCACHNLSVARRRHYLISKRGATRTRLRLRLRVAEQRTGRLPVGVFPLTSGACLLSPRRCFLQEDLPFNPDAHHDPHLEDAASHAMMGPLTGGPQCHMSILRNGNVPCSYIHNFHVDFKIAKCRLSILRKGLCHDGNTFYSIEKCPCRPADFKGQGPP